MPRYFYSELANRALTDGSTTINFTKTSIIGANICGIYTTDNPSELALLDGAIQQRAGVIEIPQDEYDQQAAQKKTTLNSVPSLTLRAVPQLAPPQQFQVKQEKQGVESVGSPEVLKSSEIRDGKVEDPRSVISVDSVNSPGLVNQDERIAKMESTPAKSRKSRG